MARNSTPRIEIKSRVFAASQKLDALFGDLLSWEHHLERALAKEFLERREVEVRGSGVKEAVSIEDANGRDAMEVGVGVEKPAE